MKRVVDRGEIDFDNDGVCRETTERKCSVFAEKLRIVRNPYTGNKRKLLVHLFTAIEKQGWEYQTFLDLFTGSGMVAATARQLGKSVTANDLSPYAYQNARFFLQAEKGLDQDDIKVLTEPTKFEGVDFVRKHYAERFTAAEAEYLDSIRKKIDVYLPGGRCGGQSIQSTIALLSVLHYVMDRCFVGGRLNKGQVLAELDHRIAHQRNEGQSMSFKDIDWLEPFIGGPAGLATNEDAIELLASFNSKKVVHDLAYIDPPYGSDQSDYMQMYRFFNEYISLERYEENQQSQRFISRKTYESNFRELLEACKQIPKLVISFSTNSFANIEDIASIVKDSRKMVDVKAIDYEYNYRGNQEVKEYLILAA